MTNRKHSFIWSFVVGFMALMGQLTTTDAQAEVIIGDSIESRIETREQRDAEPYGFDVTWIHWDSDFRNTDLQLGDRIIGLDGVRYEREQRETLKSIAIGQFLESKHWEDVGAIDGQVATLMVWRDGQLLEIAGQVFVERFYRDEEGRRTIGYGGPISNHTETDENGRRIFDSTWGSWYERKTSGQIGTWPYILNGGWERTSFNNRKELEDHLEDQARIDYLVTHYPGDFSTAMQQDWERIRVYLEGEVVPLTDEDLAYRTLLDELRQEIKGYTGSAIEAFETELGERLETVPGISRGDIEGQRQAYVGKIVYFDGLTPRNIINDLDLTLMVAGSTYTGYYFLDAESLAVAQVFDALFRYQTLVNPQLAERYSVYIEVLDDPRIVNFKGSPVMGLMGKIVGMAAGRQDVFVDARAAEGAFTFAGEQETQVAPVCALQDTDPPEATIECMVEAIKYGDEQTWRSLFATWRITPLRDGLTPLYDPDYRLRPSIYLGAWEHSRRYITTDVYDARVNRVSSIRLIHQRGPDDDVPTVEEVTVILDHIGLIDNEYRTFVNLNVRRVWRLQRQDGGPWRIADVNHL